MLRVIAPSEPHGGWPGNKRTIRQWDMCRDGTAFYDRCTDLEVIAFEHELGQIDPAKIEFGKHPTLDRVVYYDGPMLIHTKLTPEEFQLLCHNMDEKPCTRAEFEQGCKKYQDLLFGKSQ